jgi:hypothetical protein
VRHITAQSAAHHGSDGGSSRLRWRLITVQMAAH